jgi:hypothetical protein
MLAAGSDEALAPYREAFAQMAIGAIVVRDALSDAAAGEVRDRLRKLSFTPYRMLHRGHFAFVRDLEEPELCRRAVAIAELIAECKLSILRSRCLRLVRGDYVLSAEDDAAQALAPRLFDERARALDVIIDLSEGSSGEAQVVYAHRGEHFFAAPQLARSLTVVERRATVTRYHRYLNHRIGERVVHRLCLTLVRSEVDKTPHEGDA